MAIKKENVQLVKDLQKHLLSHKKTDEKALKAIGINPTLKYQEFRNIKITNDYWSGLSVDVIDDHKDLDGNLICENKKLSLRIKNLYENNTRKLKSAELSEYNIWNPSKDIVIGNLRLKNYSDFLFSVDHFEIELVDSKKNIDGLWLDDVVTVDRILDTLKQYNLSSKKLSGMKELDLNKELEILLSKSFETVKKGGRSNQGDIDLIIGSAHNYGIEIKLAREISKAAACQKAIGQIELYTRQFKGNFMVLVAGNSSEKNDKEVMEVKRKAKDCGCNYYYLETF